MNHRRFLGAAALLLPLFFACSSTPNESSQNTDTHTGGDGGTGGSPCVSSPDTSHAAPPAPGPSVAPDGAGGATFAIRKLQVGDTDRDGTPDPLAGWKQYGFDLDGTLSGPCPPATFAGHCKPRENGNLTEDGPQGIDNAFGETLLPFFEKTNLSFSTMIAGDLAMGGATLLIDLEGLGGGSDYAPLTARLYDGAPLGKVPAYDGTDVWPVWPGSLGDPADLASAKLKATDSYVVDDTWVGRFHGALTLRLPLSATVALRLAVRDPTVTTRLDPAHAQAIHGTIAGVIAFEDFVAELDDAFGQLDVALCDGPTHEGIIKEVSLAADILVDRTQDPAKTCDAVSIAVGFEAARVQLGAVTTPEPVPPPGCGDGGTPGGG